MHEQFTLAIVVVAVACSILLSTAIAAEDKVLFNSGNFPQSDGNAMPSGWSAPKEHLSRYKVMEEDGHRFLRYHSDQIEEASPSALFPVKPNHKTVLIEFEARVPELNNDERNGYFRTLFINKDCGAMEGPRIKKPAAEWEKYKVKMGVNPRADTMIIHCGFRDAAGTFDLRNVKVTLLETRAETLKKAPEFTVRDGLPNFVQKLKRAESVKIAYFGGSITAQKGWRVHTLDWFRRQYPNAQVDEINAAIGGTGSDLGAFRVQRDVVKQKPDLVFIEFAVNDSSREPQSIQESMEGIVRQIWKADSATDICFVYTVMHGHGQMMLDDLALGRYPPSAIAMEAVAEHYGIPSIHMGVKIQQMEQDGKVVFLSKGLSREERLKEMEKGIYHFSPDMVHPFEDTGHVLYTEAILRGMKEILPAGTAGKRALSVALMADNWEDAKFLPFGEVAELTGWERLPKEHELMQKFKDRMPVIWKGTPGDTATIRFKGSMLRLYDLDGPSCGRIQVSLDGQEPEYLDRFSQYSANGYRLTNVEIASGLDPESVHTVTIVIPHTGPDKRAILTRLKDQNRHALELDETEFEAKYAGNHEYIGMICLRGQVVKE